MGGVKKENSDNPPTPQGLEVFAGTPVLGPALDTGWVSVCVLL